MTDGFSDHEAITSVGTPTDPSDVRSASSLERSRTGSTSDRAAAGGLGSVFILHLTGELVKLTLMIQMKKVDGFGKIFMPIQQQSPGIRSLESAEEFFETRLEAIGFIFHGTVTESKGKGHSGRSPSNLLHFARCAKLEKVGETETKIWFRSVRVALKHLDELIGHHRWKWCKICEREITQRILDEN